MDAQLDAGGYDSDRVTLFTNFIQTFFLNIYKQNTGTIFDKV